MLRSDPSARAARPGGPTLRGANWGATLSEVLDYLASEDGRPVAEELAECGDPWGTSLSLVSERGDEARSPSLPRRLWDLAEDDFTLQGDPARWVTTALAGVTPPAGRVRPPVVGRALGRDAAAHVRRIVEGIRARPLPPLPNQTKYEGIQGTLLEQIVHSASGDYGASRMPALLRLSRILARRAGDDRPLKIFDGAASMTHLFATKPALYLALERNGLSRRRHHVTGKGYSRHVETLLRMLKDGWKVDRSLLSLRGDYAKGTNPEEARALETLATLFHEVDPTSDKRFLIIDDGGYLVAALHKHFRAYAHLCTAVETTSNGWMRIDDEIGIAQLACPVIDVARSEIKKHIESIIIAHAIMESLEASLREAHPDLHWNQGSVALLGFGDVNEAVAAEIAQRGIKKRDIWIWDPKPERREAARQAGYSVPTETQAKHDETEARKEVVRRGFLTLSATGRKALRVDEYKHLPDGAIVVNAGSGNFELGLHEIDDTTVDVAPLGGNKHYRNITTLSEARKAGEPPTEEIAKQLLLNGMKGLSETRSRLQMLGVTPSKVASVLGYDANGRTAVSMLLGAGFDKENIWIGDTNEGHLEKARRDGFRTVDRETAIRHSGFIWMNDDNLARGDEAEELERAEQYPVVVYCHTPRFDLGSEAGFASSNSFRGLLINDASGRAGIGMRHRVLKTGCGKEVLVLRSGAVINMETGIPPEYVQFIFSMVLAGCMQAVDEKTPGPRKLKDQDLIVDVNEKHLRRIGRSLRNPSFKGLAPAWWMPTGTNPPRAANGRAIRSAARMRTGSNKLYSARARLHHAGVHRA
ncbi:MAG: hypothetical protein H6729_12330 [Deltaproteobacteria bacterium]|nr:hypothetical protein [Deltaproteobacteria bacterium]